MSRRKARQAEEVERVLRASVENVLGTALVALRRQGEAVDRALEIAMQHGGTDGAHHKQWVIDQMVRALTDCPMVQKASIDCHGKPYSYEAQGESEDYRRWVAERCDGEDGPETYSWDVGIPP